MTPVELNDLLEQKSDGSTKEIILHYIFLSQEHLASKFELFFKDNFSWSPNQTRVLCYLKYYKKVSMSDLASFIHVSRQLMTQTVDSLEKLGLAKRKYDPENRRAVYVEATKEGLKQLDTGERRFVSHIERAIYRLPIEEANKTIEAIQTVSALIKSFDIVQSDKMDIVF